MRKLSKNPTNGFLETKRSFPSTNVRSYSPLTAEKKQSFLNVTRDFISATKMMPNLAEICEELNVKMTNFYIQINEDPEFKREYKDIISNISAHYVSKLAHKAEKDSGVIANLAMLKYLETGSFVDRLNVKQSVNIEMNEKVYSAITVDIDPEIPHIKTMQVDRDRYKETVDNQPIASAKNTESKPELSA